MEEHYRKHKRKFEERQRELENLETILDYYSDTSEGALDGMPEISSRLFHSKNFQYVGEVVDRIKALIAEPSFLVTDSYSKLKERMQEKINIYQGAFHQVGLKMMSGEI